jgi:CheY-like chemotaxis protein
LGLATVYGIVRQSNGHIFAESEPGRGATFAVYLPRVEEMVQSQRAGRTDTRSPHGTETILLVEDGESVRKLARRVLERWGYTVLEASDASQALALCKEHQGAIHLLLTDVIMPGGDGRSLAEQVIAFRPDIHVLYMSGYSEDVIAYHGVLDPGIHFLTKPFTPRVLARAVRRVLDDT